MLFSKEFFIFTLLVYSFESCMSQTVDQCDYNFQVFLNLLKPPQVEKGKIPPGFMTTPDLILSNGFDYEGYHGVTEDGFVLAYHRIVTNTPGGPPVLIMHGLILASESWLLTGRQTDLAFQLADAGYDVWLGDQRGNWYSREHVEYKPNMKKFWDFSMHESGIYDLPVFIDGIVNVTKYPQVTFIGSSMSCNEILILLSLRPEYNSKIKVAILLAPVAVTPPPAEFKSPYLRVLVATGGLITDLGERIGLFEILPRDLITVETLRKCCGPSSPLQPLCFYGHSLLFGEHRSNFNKTLFGYTLAYSSAGTSLKTGRHMWQLLATARFAQFDYGREENVRRYQSPTPPLYPLENITSPIVVYWGGNDVLVNEEAIAKLASSLPNVIEVYKVPDPKFNHIDFIWGLNAYSLVNIRLIEFLNSLYYYV